MPLDKGQGVWPFLNRRRRIGIYVLTIGLYPWILYDKLRRRSDDKAPPVPGEPE